MCWLGFWLCTRDGRLKAGLLRDCCHPNNLFLGLDLWYKDMVWQKKKRKKKKTVSGTGLSLCADQDFDFAQEMGD